MKKETELKTFNDIPLPILQSFEIRKLLKSEAVKWVRECRVKFGYSATCDFWMEKLGITEEDLK